MEKFEIIGLRYQPLQFAKSAEQIFAVSNLLNLSCGYLGGSEQFIKVGGSPANIAQMMEYLRTVEYDPEQDADDDDTI